MLAIPIVTALVAAVLSGSSPLPTAAHPDDINWWDGFAPPGIVGEVHDLIVHDGAIYAGGLFTEASGRPAVNFAWWNGRRWVPEGEFPGGAIHVLMSYGTAIFAAGEFTEAGGLAARGTAHRDPAGMWSPMGNGMNGPVYALARHMETVYAGGDFDEAGGEVAHNFAHWNGIDWEPAGDGYVLGPIRCLEHFDKALYVGGEFSGPADCQYIAYWDGVYHALVYNGMDGFVHALLADGLNLYVGGGFSRAGNVEVTNAARWTHAHEFHPMDPMNMPLPFVHDFTLYYGDLIAAGSNGRVARYDYSSDAWEPLGGSLVGQMWTSHVRTLLVTSEGLLAGGDFLDGVARWDGERWRRRGGGLDGTVACLATYDDKLVAAGSFEIEPIEGLLPSCFGIGLWDGSTWLEAGTGLLGAVNAIIVHDGGLVAGGEFTEAGGVPADYVARWDGEGWEELGGGMNLYGFVRDFAVYDGDLVAVGDFGTAGGVAASRVAAWDGASWHALGSGVAGRAHAAVVYGGDLVVGGEFTLAGGVPANHVARWNGVTWTALGDGLNDEVYALEVHGGDLIAGGRFTEAGGQPANRVARWNGSDWEPMGEGTDDEVYSLRSTSAGLFVGGRFVVAGGEVVNGIARWQSGNWTGLGSGVSGGDPWTSVDALHAHDGRLYLGGNFTGAGDKLSDYIARWNEEVTPVLLSDFQVTPGVGCVTIRWVAAAESSPSSFRLVGARGSESWDVAFRRETSGAYVATDRAPILAGGGDVEYRLYARFDDTEWELIRSELVTVAPAAGAVPSLSVRPTPIDTRGIITFEVPDSRRVRLVVYDAAGRHTRLIADRTFDAGRHAVTWDGLDDRGNPVASGVYWIRLETDETATRTAVVLR